MISKDAMKKFCFNYTEIENYKEAVSDTSQTWDCHHRKEITEGKTRHQLINEGLYYNRPPDELIFLTHAEHVRLHSSNISEEVRKKLSETFTGRVFTEEWKKKISESKKGANNAMYGKCCELHPFYGKHHSEESKKKMSESTKGQVGYWTGKHRSEETRKKISEKIKASMTEEQRKKLSDKMKGRISPRKGKHLSEETRKKISENTKKGMTPEVRKKISEAKKRRFEVLKRQSPINAA